MRNVLLVARREYLERIRTRGFLLATVLIPLLMGTLIIGSMLLMTNSKTQSHVAIVTGSEDFGQEMKRQLESGQQAKMKVDLYAPSDAVRGRLNTQLHAKDSTLAGYLWVTPGATAESRPNVAYSARSAGDIATANALQEALRAVLIRERLTAHGLSTGDIDQLTAPVRMDTSSSGDAEAAFLAAYMLFFLMYMVIMLYGMNTARSIIDEKTSRIFEVLLATIRPEELLAGKILGVGAVGLTQISVWMLAAFAFAGSESAPALAAHRHSSCSTSSSGSSSTLRSPRRWER
jgi:ABC-2 type transport system permease protein